MVECVDVRLLMPIIRASRMPPLKIAESDTNRWHLPARRMKANTQGLESVLNEITSLRRDPAAGTGTSVANPYCVTND